MMLKSPKAESNGGTKNLSLIHKLQALESEWLSLEKSRPANPHRSSTPPSSLTFDHLLQNSPMSSPQDTHHNTMSSLRSCHVAVEEILSDRRTAIARGRLKGRQLFLAGDDDKLGLALPEEWVEEKEVVVEDGGGSGGEKAPVVGHGRRGWSRAAGWVVGVLVLAILGVGFFMRCDGKYVHEKEEVMLVPT